jgi:hypothetical protein
MYNTFAFVTIPPIVIYNDMLYVKNSSIISIDVADENFGHAICGYTCNDKMYIYDSNRMKNKKIDWMNPDLMMKYYNGVYKTKRRVLKITDIRPDVVIYTKYVK